MNSVFGRSRLFFGLVGVLSIASMDASAAPTIALKAVAINGSPIAPTNSVDLVPGDTVTSEILLSDWTGAAQEKLFGYQAVIRREAFVSGTRGDVLPVGWDAPATSDEEISCTTSATTPANCLPSPDCPAEFPCCRLTGGGFGTCVGANHNPTQGLFIDRNRPDYVFINPSSGSPFPSFPALDISGPSFRFAGALLSPADAQLYTIPPKYAGSIVFQASDDACGTFSVNFIPGTPSDRQTDLFDPSNLVIPGLLRQRLIVRVTSPGAAPGQCSCRDIVATSVPNCAIDARQPTDPDGTNPQIPRSVTFTFDCEDTTDIADTANFTRTFAPAAFTPFLASAVANGSDVTLSLTGPMLEKKWNCFKFNPTGVGVCVGIMPGDVNGDGRSQAFTDANGMNDISALEACLNSPGTCTLLQCDINRSGACGPQDLLREIDLLGGLAGGFPSYDGKGILDFSQQVVACPFAP